MANEIEVAKKNLPANVAKYFEESSAQDFENVDPDDITHPRLALQQSLSPLVNEGTAKVGQIRGNIDGHVYLENPKKDGTGDVLQIIPVFYWKSRIRFRSRDEGGGMLCRADDGKNGRGDPGGSCDECSMTEWGEGETGKDRQPECTAIHNFVVLCPEHEAERRLIILSMQRTQYKVGKQWFNAMRGLPGRMFVRQYQLGVHLVEEDFTYWNYKIVPHGDTNRIDKPLSDAALIEEAAAAAELFRRAHQSGEVTVAYEDDPAQATEPAQTEEERAEAFEDAVADQAVGAPAGGDDDFSEFE